MGRYEPLGAGQAGGMRVAGGVAPSAYGALWLALAAIALAIFCWPGLAWVVTAWERPEYSHGYLIGPIALYLFVSQLQRDLTPEGTPRGGAWGVATVGLGLLVGLLGSVIDAPGITVYGFAIAIAGLVLAAMGTRRGLRYWAPVIYLVFMLPLPTAIYWQLSLALQLISSQLGVAVISSLGIPVVLDGNIIDLGNYKLQVAEACSGLRYLFPLASFGFLFAVLYKGPRWHKVVLFLSTVPITVMMNSFRIGVIGILVDRYGIEQADGFLHFFEGWIIFVGCVVILYFEAIVLQRFTAKRQPVRKMLEIDFAGLAAAVGRARDFRASRALVIAALAIMVACLALYLAPARALSPPARDPLVLFPMSLGTWQGKLSLLDPETEATLEADDYLDADFAGPRAGDLPVNLFVAYYTSLNKGSGIHSPAVCLPAGGWEVSAWTTVATGLTSASGAPLSVNRAIIQMGFSRQLVYYWFQERERSLTNDYVAKAYTVWDGIGRGRMDGALVRVITPIDPSISVDVADARLRGFLRLALPELPLYVPS
jgi:exosortase D (VPLPA-CTERM-specific)